MSRLPWSTSDDWRPLAETLLGKAEFTPIDVARETQFELDDLRRMWRALGFPPVPDDARVFTRSEIEILRTVRQFIERRAPIRRSCVQLTRVTGQSLARIADAQVTDAAERLNRRTRGDLAARSRAAELISRIQVLAARLRQAPRLRVAPPPAGGRPAPVGRRRRRPIAS